jgi:hypothetical protein
LRYFRDNLSIGSVGLEEEFVAEQATDTVDGTGAVAGTGTGDAPAYGAGSHLEHNPGRPISWVGTTITVIGFVIGGVAFPISNPGPNWVFFWIGAGVAIVGCFVLLFSKAMTTDWY